MDAMSSTRSMRRGQFQRILPLLFLIILVGWAMSSPMNANADAGGWPTATPTLTPIPATATPTEEIEPTPLPTIPLIVFPPTNTPTSPAPGALEGQAIPQVLLETEPAPGRNITTLLCWPLAIILLIGIIVGLVLLRNRILAAAP
jgi:hypothetical protein